MLGLRHGLQPDRQRPGATGSATSAVGAGREDDTEEALAVRLREYHEKTNPVLEIFRRKEYVISVDARPGPQLVQQEIRDKPRAEACRVRGAGHPGSRDGPGHLR